MAGVTKRSESRVSREYALALIDLAEEQKQTDIFYEQSQMLIQIFEKDPNFIAFINHPRVHPKEKEKVITNAFKGRAADEIVSLMILLLHRGRGGYIPSVIHEFYQLVRENKGWVTAVVYSAAPLDKTQLKELRSKLEKGLKKTVDIETIIDENLIAGLKIKVNGLIIDGTIQKKIETLKNSLLKS